MLYLSRTQWGAQPPKGGAFTRLNRRRVTGVVFHHSKTLHTSHRNESDQWRRAYATHWASAGVVSELDTIKNSYYNCHTDLYHEALGN